jgi:hypothetical protein
MMNLEDLRQRVVMPNAAGFDEVLVAYVESADLDIAAQLRQS